MEPDSLTSAVRPIAEGGAAALEIAGVAATALIAALALLLALVAAVRREPGDEIFKSLRHRLARGILLGLEFLVAADIIHTVAIDLTFASVGVLAIVVLIRTFLSFTLEVEIDGRWPWQGRARAQTAEASGR